MEMMEKENTLISQEDLRLYITSMIIKLDGIFEKYKDNEDIVRAAELHRKILRMKEKLIPEPIPENAKKKTQFDLELEANMDMFIQNYCIIGIPNSSIKAADFAEKYNKIAKSEISLIRIGKAMAHMYTLYPIKKQLKSNGTFYTNISFRDDM